MYEAWLRLDEDSQRAADSDFAAISRLANDAGRGVLVEEGNFHKLDLAADLAEFGDTTDAVLWTFIAHPRVFDVATLFYAADAIGSRSWQKWKGLGQSTPKDDQASCRILAERLREFFLTKQGRGRHCKVEVYQRGGSYYYFAFPEDYARAEQDFDEHGNLVKRTHSPVFQVVFVFSPSNGALDTSAPGGRLVVEKLMALAVETLLGTERPDAIKDDRAYDLELLRAKDFEWKYPASSGISSVGVKALRLSAKSAKERIVLEADSPAAVYGLADRLAGSKDRPGPIPHDSVFLTKATIRVEYGAIGGKRGGHREFTVTWPNLCNLGQDEKDRTLRQMLISSGIDPQAIGNDDLR